MCVGVPALILASTAVGAAGQGISAISAHRQAGYEAAIATANAGRENARAEDALDRGRLENRRFQRRLSQEMGEQNAALAANGIDITYGSAAGVRGDTAMFGREDVDTINRNAMREATGYEINAANFRSEASSMKRRASGALVEGAFGMGSTILGGATQYRKFQASRRGGY